MASARFWGVCNAFLVVKKYASRSENQRLSCVPGLSIAGREGGCQLVEYFRISLLFFHPDSFLLPAIIFPLPFLLPFLLLPLPLIRPPVLRAFPRSQSSSPPRTGSFPFLPPRPAPLDSASPLLPTMAFDSNRNTPWPAQTAVPQVPESSTSRRRRTSSANRRRRLPVQPRQSSSVPDQTAIGSYFVYLLPPPPPSPTFPPPIRNPLALGRRPRYNSLLIDVLTSCLFRSSSKARLPSFLRKRCPLVLPHFRHRGSPERMGNLRLYVLDAPLLLPVFTSNPQGTAVSLNTLRKTP